MVAHVNEAASLIDQVTLSTHLQNIPYSTLFELTHRCNLTCGHCYVVPDPKPELTLEEAKKVLDQLAEEKCLYITFTGGEVLTRSDFFHIAKHAKGHHFAIRIFTNGTLITPQVADKISALGPLEVGISIYGANPREHEFVTGVQGSFKRSIRALRLLSERGVRTAFKTLLMHHNVHSLPKMGNLARDLGASFRVDPMVTFKNDHSKEPLRYSATDEDLELLFANENWIAELESTKDHKQSRLDTICRAGRDFCSISPSGDVYPCVQFPLKLGNLREKSLHEIWAESLEIQRLRAITRRDLSECLTCRIQRYCWYCMGLAYIETGSLTGRSSLNCRMAKVLARIAKKGGE